MQRSFAFLVAISLATAACSSDDDSLSVGSALVTTDTPTTDTPTTDTTTTDTTTTDTTTTDTTSIGSTTNTDVVPSTVSTTSPSAPWVASAGWRSVEQVDGPRVTDAHRVVGRHSTTTEAEAERPKTSGA